MDKKKLFLWALYDFANSVVFINFLLYFAQWLVIDGGLSDFWYNALFAISTILLFLSAPMLASFTDKHGGRKYFLNISTIGTFVSYGLAAWMAGSGSHNIFVMAILFLFGQYFYQLSFVFYNPMLEEVSDESHRARASGIGQFANSLGQIAGLLITLPLAHSRIAPLLPSGIIFIILALPMMLFFKETRTRERGISFSVMKTEAREFKRKLIAFLSVSVATPMLLSFFFFNDALITLSNNYSLYMERVFGIPDKTKSILLLMILVMSAIGGIIAGYISDRIGAIKTLKFILLGWALLLPVVALVHGLTSFIISTALVGLLIGSVWTVTRAYMSTLLSKDEVGYGFSLYTLMERFATFIGPLAWGGTLLLVGNDSFGYRMAVLVMAFFVLVGFIVLSKWKREPVPGI